MSLGQDNIGNVVQVMPLAETVIISTIIPGSDISIVELEAASVIEVLFKNGNTETITTAELRHYSVPSTVKELTITSGIVRVS